MSDKKLVLTKPAIPADANPGVEIVVKKTLDLTGTDTQIAIWKVEGEKAGQSGKGLRDNPYDVSASVTADSEHAVSAWSKGWQTGYEHRAMMENQPGPIVEDGHEEDISITEEFAKAADAPTLPAADAVINDSTVTAGKVRDSYKALVRRREFLARETERVNRDIKTVAELAVAKNINLAGTEQAAVAELEYTQHQAQGDGAGMPEKDGTYIVGKPLPNPLVHEDEFGDIIVGGQDVPEGGIITDSGGLA